MLTEQSSPAELKQLLSSGVLHRLPITFLPFVNQQLHQWNYLFPNEREFVERLLVFVNSLDEKQSAAVFRPVYDLEQKMGVREWKFSTYEQTIENSSLLARSSYYQEWRAAVQQVFNAAEQYRKEQGTHQPAGNRLILLDIPSQLDVDPARTWPRWADSGRLFQWSSSGIPRDANALDILLTSTGERVPSLLSVAAARSGSSLGDSWVFDAGESLVKGMVRSTSATPQESISPILLSHKRLNALRESFSHEMNSMRKDLSDADAVYDRLRKVDILPWCPPEVAQEAPVREFVRNLYLSGNGAVIFGNSFVQWGASEALRRARPSFLAARFGVRTKPKPFTGVAVFDDPDKINPLPAADDLPGSAVDAQILSSYVWMAAARYPEYQTDTVCICLAESRTQAYIIAPKSFKLPPGTETLDLTRLSAQLREWIG